MPKKDTRQNSKEFQYFSPSKSVMTTPITAAFKSSRYDVGAFLEKIEALNKVTKKINDAEQKKKRELGEENTPPYEQL
ncbi:hypothetical protein GINT2_001072 [Glugoides intestinalis]